MRKLILILFILLSCASVANTGGIISFPGGGGESTVCTEIYSDNFTEDDNLNVGQNVNRPWAGLYFTPTADMDVCKIDIWIDAVSGTLTAAHEYYIEIWSLTAGDFNAKLGQSSKLEGASFSANTYISANAGFAEFATSVPLTAATQYAIVMILDSDATPGDSPPEVDADDYPRVGYDNGNNGAGEDGDGAQGGRVLFDTSGNAAVTDAEDDFKIEIWSDQ